MIENFTLFCTFDICNKKKTNKIPKKIIKKIREHVLQKYAKLITTLWLLEDVESISNG